MRIAEGVEWGIHACTLLAALPQGKSLPTKRIAEFFELPEHYLAKQVQLLMEAGIISTRRGPGGGCSLARSPEDITLLDIVFAIEGRESHFRCSEIRRNGPSGVAAGAYKLPCGIARAMWRAESAWRRELQSANLRDIQLEALSEAPPKQLEKATKWLAKILD